MVDFIKNLIAFTAKILLKIRVFKIFLIQSCEKIIFVNTENCKSASSHNN